MGKKERFSLRKYKVGLVSVLIGAVFLAGHVAADEVNSALQVNQVGIEQAVQVVDSSQAVDETQVELAIEQTSEVSSQTVNQDGLNLSDNQEASLPTENEVTDNTQDKISTVSNETLDSTPQQEASQAKQPETPQSIDTDEQIKVPEVWESGYKGQGTVVAIIDSGLDVDHDVLHITDPSKAKYKSQEEMDAAKAAAGITYGKWFNDKVIFGYNYVDGNTNLKEGIEDSHGMHVTGIAAGNPTQKAGDEYIYGVAPEAQVIFLRVFSDFKNTTGPALYVRAIEDAVKLGADSINLSLGSTTGSTANIEESLLEAIEAAQRAGVTVVISAGNDGAFGDNQKPFAENIDYGLVGNPSTAKGAISVASYNSDYTRGQAITFVGMENNADLNYGRCPFSDPNKSEKKFEIGRDYDYVYVGTGTAEEVQEVDLTGKIALIKRGGSTFSEKIANAIAQGAEGVFIYNNDPQGANISMSLDDSAIAIPAVFIPYKFGNALANGNYKIRFSGNLEKFDNIEAGHFSSFSSWGLTSDGELKPDVSAPGGSIYSSFNDGQYGLMSDTSMAAPHVTGVVALVKQYLKEKYPEKSDAEIAYLVKALIMSNAKAHYDEQAGEFSSPRQQGAGLVDTASAISSGLYLTGDDGYGSITLGNVGDTFNFDVTIHNISDQDKTLTYETNLQTDAVEDGKITLSPRHLASIAGRTITVKANSSEKVMITVDARQFAELLTKEMPNGYYLEGFVRFLDSVDFAEVVSLPFVGFRGDFQNLTVVEDPVYKLVSDGKEGFYLEIDGDHIVSGSDDTTALLTNSTDSSRQIVLGTYANNAGDFVLHLDENGTTRLAISPNNDGKQDFVAFKGVFLRNYTVELALYDTDAAELAGPTSQIIKLSDADSYKTVNFYVHMRNQAALVLDFDKELPKGTTVSISNKNGKLTVIPAARYAKKDYGKNVYVGDYTLELPLPVGYELYEDPHFTVVYGKQNHIAFSIIDKTALIAETQAINGIENEARYYNASLEKLLAYRDALTSAQAILSGKYTQVEVDAALQTLQDAIEALDGKTTDFKALTEEDSQFQAEQEDPAYYNAGVAARTTYDTQHRKVNLVLAKGSVTQEEVDATLKKLKSAREALDGKATDFRALSNLSNKSKVLKVTSAKYKNASEPAKTAYNQALVEAQAVLSNSEATQGEVDAALANLKAAEAELDGKEKQTTSTQTELNDFIPKEVIKSETPPQSMRTQSASEKGGEVVALGVNKRGLAGKSASALKQSKETAYLPTTSSQLESFLVSLGFIILAGVSLIWKN